MNKKIAILALALCMIAAIAVTGTLAYFTATDSETNTFTVGNVKIELIESQYHRVNAGKGYTTAAEPLKGGYLWASNVDLLGNSENSKDSLNYNWNGGFFSDEQIQNDAETYKTGYFAEKATNMMPGSNVRKNPYVKNTGANDVYVRVRVAVPVSLFKVLDKGASYWTDAALKDGVTSKAVAAYRAAGNTADLFMASKESEQFVKDGYYEFDFVYEKPLAAGQMTFWNVWGNIAIDPNANETDLANVTTFDVKVYADAIQADGFANGTDAFVAFDAKHQ